MRRFAALLLAALLLAPSASAYTETRSLLSKALANSLYCQLSGCTMTGDLVAGSTGANGVAEIIFSNTSTTAKARLWSIGTGTTATAYFSQNASFDGANYNRDDVAQPAWLYGVNGSDGFIILRGSAAANPITWTTLVSMDNAGAITARTPNATTAVSLTAQAASVGTTNLYASAPAGLYRVCWSQQITQAATTSSSLLTTIGWNNGSAKTATIAALNGGAYQTTADASNTLNSTMGNCVSFTSAASQNITYATTYASSGATAMNYSLRVSVERLQ